MFDFKNKTVVITGGARGIGKRIRERFEAAGATVCVIDLLPNDYFVGDIAEKETLECFAAKVISDLGRVDILVNNAAPRMCGIDSGSYEDFEYALRVGVTAPFYLSKLFAPHFAEGASIVDAAFRDCVGLLGHVENLLYFEFGFTSDFSVALRSCVRNNTHYRRPS